MIFGGNLGRSLLFIPLLILMVTFGYNDAGRVGRLVGTWNSLCGTQYKMLHTWYLLHCSALYWYLVLGIFYTVSVTCNIVHCLVLVLSGVHLTSTAWAAASQCIWCLSLGTWYLVLVHCTGTWYLVQYIHCIILYPVLGQLLGRDSQCIRCLLTSYQATTGAATMEG